MNRRRKTIASVLCVLMMSGLAAANCGNCSSGKKKACPADCTKTCCAKKSCSEDCQKPCCAKKSCSDDCKKPCCAKAEAKKGCGKNCQKACCAVLGKAAPDFTLKDLAGKDVQFSKLKDKIVVLEWTNYDCPFVKAHYAAETNTAGKLAKKYADQDVVWLTINSTHYATAETNKEWAKKHQVKQPVLVDADGKVGKLFRAKTTPHMYVIDADGKVVYQGAMDNAPMGKVPEGKEKVNYVDKALAELLAGKPVTTSKTKPYGCSVKYAKK